MSQLHCIENRTRGTLVAERAEVANRSWSRLKGLLGRSRFEPGQALVITPCQGVHTLFMAFPIDVVHVDRRGVVQRIIPELAPNRFGPVLWDTHYVVELPAGTARLTGTQIGDLLRVA